MQSKPVAYHSQDFAWEDLQSEVEASSAHDNAFSNTTNPRHCEYFGSRSEISNEQCEACLPVPANGLKKRSGANGASLEGTLHQAQAWEGFHTRHTTARFFKERRYLLEEFPDLKAGPLKILEVGCGSGSTTVPLLTGNPQTLVYACDCSPAAVAHTSAAVQKALGLVAAAQRFRGFCWNAASEPFPFGVFSEKDHSGADEGSIGSEGVSGRRLDQCEEAESSGKCEGFVAGSGVGTQTLESALCGVERRERESFLKEGLERSNGGRKSWELSEEGKGKHGSLGPRLDTGGGVQDMVGKRERAGVNWRENTGGALGGGFEAGGSKGLQTNGCGNGKEGGSVQLDAFAAGGEEEVGTGLGREKLGSQAAKGSEEASVFGTHRKSDETGSEVLFASWGNGSPCTETIGKSCSIADPACVAGRVHSDCILDIAEEADSSLLERADKDAGRAMIQGAGSGVPRRAAANDGKRPVWDAEVGTGLAEGFDFAMLIFTLSAVHPTHMPFLLRRLHQQLRPGGSILFRDYGLYDMTMLRFPPEQKVGERLFRRLDGTLSYFFSKEALAQLARQSGFAMVDCEYCCVALTNKRKNVRMKRVWLHARLQKQASAPVGVL